MYVLIPEGLHVYSKNDGNEGTTPAGVEYSVLLFFLYTCDLSEVVIIIIIVNLYTFNTYGVGY